MPYSFKKRRKCHLIWKEVSPGSFHLKTLWAPWNCLHVIVGVLHRTSKKKDLTYSLSSYETLTFRSTYMTFFLSPAHIGIDKTLEKFKNRLFWPGIKECGKDYCKSCSLLSQKTIQKTKQSNTKKLHFLDLLSE